MKTNSVRLVETFSDFSGDMKHFFKNTFTFFKKFFPKSTNNIRPTDGRRRENFLSKVPERLTDEPSFHFKIVVQN